MVRRFIFSLCLFSVLFSGLNAQPILDFKRIEVRYPEISLVFKVTCKGTFRNDMGVQHFEVRENGMLVKDVSIWCPENTDCCISASMVFDRSGSMQGTKIQQVKDAGNIFVDQLNPDGKPCDEASVVSFSNTVSLDVPMTTDKTMLKTAINNMKASGMTALWDAVALGIQQLLDNARNRCKAVIVLTDGGDNNSEFHTLNSVINRALASRVQVYTIGFGLISGSKPERDLQALSSATGGLYYHSPDGSGLAEIYRTIKQTIKEGFLECYIKYNTGCPDGTLRTVDLTLKDFCNGSSVASRWYIAPLDRSKFKTVKISLGKATVYGTEEVIIPVILETPVNEIFGKSDFTVVYDRGLMQLMGLSTTGTLLENVPVTMQDIGSGHLIQIREHVEMNGKGVLMYLRFKTADVLYRAECTLWLYNWSFLAYCLTPEITHGLVTILQREPILSCDAIVPEKISWDDNKKIYSPNPFTVSAKIRNTGNKEARNVRARIKINSPGLILSSPLVNEQTVSPVTIYPGQEGFVSWDLRALKQENPSTMNICFSITSDNHTMFECCKDIIVNMAQSPSLVCSLNAPDTIFFREQYYEPEEFDINLTATNTGSGQTKDVYGQLLQDTRFTIIPPASLLLAPTLPPAQQVNGTFRVRMHPRQTDGYDTVHVNVQGNDTDPAWCSYPIWVQRERAPKFSLLCTTPNDSLVFSELTYDYQPNPFTVTTIAENIGETYAEECQLMFVGPPRFTPIGTNLRPLGTMQVNDTRTEQWTIRALPRTIGGWDTLVFQVLGKGGLGRKIVIGECRLPVYVPALRRPVYELECSMPDSLLYINNKYTPDPFTFTLRISNKGNAAGRALTPTLVLPSSIQFAAGEKPWRFIPELKVGESIDIAWQLTAEQRSVDAILKICGRAVDSIGISGECCREIFVPRVRHPDLTLSCLTIDTLYIENGTGEYIGNPFEVTLNVSNTGQNVAEHVKASISIQGPYMQLLDSPEIVLGDLAPGGSREVKWRVYALKRTIPSNIPIRIRVSGDNHDDRQCTRSVFIPAWRWPTLSPFCSSIPEDSLFFNWDKGDFEPSEFSVHLFVKNTGLASANNVSALLVVPSGVVLAKGETTQKQVLPSNLAPGESGTTSWILKPLRQRDDVTRTFSFVARADNADYAECSDDLFIQGSPKSSVLSIPSDILFRFGQKGLIPIMIDKTIGKELSSYSFELSYDPEVLALHYVTNDATLTALGWVGSKIRRISDGRIEISDYTTSSPLNTETGVLVNMFFEGIYRGGNGRADFGRSELHISPKSAVLNFGEISVSTIDGAIYVTNDCLEPLTANAGYVLEQNNPNPFNPETIISFSIPRQEHIRLVIFDKMGRELLVLVDEMKEQGKHSVRFDGSSLESGLFFYRLETSRGFEVRKMILAR